MALLEGRHYVPPDEKARLAALLPQAQAECAKMSPSQRYLRGLYCGGSLAEETIALASGLLGPIWGNVAFDAEHMLPDSSVSTGNCLIDLGAEEFTLGRPHVAIDPSITEDYTAADALAGMYVTCTGYVKLYNSTYEMPYLGASASPTGGAYTPNVTKV